MNVELTRDYIFIKHSGSRLLTQFTRDGKFVRHFGTEGRGPKEYALMRLFSVDEENELVFIHTNWTRKILIYNFDGEFIKTLKFQNLGRGHFTWSRDSFLISFSEPQIGNAPAVFIEHNFSGDTLQTVVNHIFWDKNESSNSMVMHWGQNNFYRFENKLHMKGCYNDTIYTYNDKNKIIPKYFINLKNHKIPDELVYERKSTRPLPDKCYWVGINESNKYIFVRYGLHGIRKIGEGEEGCVLFNKTSKQGLALKNNGEKYGFINDLTAGPDFKPRFSNDSLAWVSISALDMKLHLDSEKFKNQTVEFPKEKEKLIQLNKSLKEDGNHFLMVAKLKG